MIMRTTVSPHASTVRQVVQDRYACMCSAVLYPGGHPDYMASTGRHTWPRVRPVTRAISIASGSVAMRCSRARTTFDLSAAYAARRIVSQTCSFTPAAHFNLLTFSKKVKDKQ